MKKTLLIAILALSINALAQSKHPTSRLNENVQDRMHNKGMKISNLNSEMILGKTVKSRPNSPQDLIQIYDSIYYWAWDTINMGWIIDAKTINMVYDAKNNMTSNLGQYWDGSVWVNSHQYTYTYDAKNNQTNFIYAYWDGSAWINSYQYTYAYDADNNLTNRLTQGWNGSVWLNSYQYTYTYDANNNLTIELFQIWENSAWGNHYQNIYSYNANNKITNGLFQTWTGGAWVNSFYDTYTYDASNNMTSGLTQTWNGSAWENSGQFTCTYDAKNDLTKELVQNWNGNAWENSEQYIYTYDANDNMTSQLNQGWNGSNWVNKQQYTTTSDANHFEKSYVFKYWNSTGIKVSSGDSSYNYYHTVLGINNLMAHEGSITVYPNPASTKISITTSAITTKSQLSIMNLSGQQLITRQITEPKTQLDISTLPSGVYFVRLTNDRTVETGKFIKK